MSLYPVSHRSTRNAQQKVIGRGAFEVANAAVCATYKQQINREQPALWPGFESISNFHLNVARLARSEDGFSRRGYLSGALIFFAATESQALHVNVGSGIKKLSLEEISAWRESLTRDTISPDDKKDLLISAHNMTPDQDLDKVMNASVHDRDAVRKQILESNMGSYLNNPLIEEYLEQGKDVARTLLGAANLAISQFLGDEPHFASYMQDSWDRYPSQITVAQQLGAANMRDFLQSAGIE